MSGRKRSAPGGATKAQIAAAINARRNAKFPYTKYGSAHYLRGSEGSLAQFGSSFKAASPYQKQVRRSTGFVGRGAYMGRMMGNFVGGPTGGRIGSAVENYAIDRFVQPALTKYRGSGMYKMQGTDHATNALIMSRNDVTTSKMSDTGAVLITRSEYIKDITPTSGGFQTQFSAALNPGISTSFEWISQIAQFYEQYEFVQLFYEFKSTVTPGNSTAQGTVSITPLQTESSIYSDKTSMSFAQGFVNASVSRHLLAGVECHPDKIYGGSVKRVRVGEITDPSLINYDYGSIQVATNDCTANQTVGELWCHFTVKLSQPRLGNVTNSNAAPANPTISLNTNDGELTGLSAVASQAATNFFGLTGFSNTIVPSIFDSLPIQSSDWQLGRVANSNLYNCLISTTSAVAMGANCPFLKILPNSGFDNKRIMVMISLAYAGATVSGTGSLLGSNPLLCAVVGDITPVADKTFDYVKEYQPNVTVTNPSLNAGRVMVTYFFDMGDLSSGTNGLFLSINAGASILTWVSSTTISNSVMIRIVNASDSEFSSHTIDIN